MLEPFSLKGDVYSHGEWKGTPRYNTCTLRRIDVRHTRTRVEEKDNSMIVIDVRPLLLVRLVVWTKCSFGTESTLSVLKRVACLYICNSGRLE